MAQLANVSLMFTAHHHCGIHAHATQLRNRYHAIPPWPASSIYRHRQTTNLPSRLLARPPSSLSLSLSPGFFLVCTRWGGGSFPPPRSSMYAFPRLFLPSLSSSTLRPLSISSTNLVTMTNKNRKRGCPLNYLLYFVGEEVESSPVEFSFFSPFSRQFLFFGYIGHIGSKAG